MIDYSDVTRTERVSPSDGHYFFGYYDISPESPDGSKVLLCRTDFIDRNPTANDKLEIGYLDYNKNKFISIGNTTAWNFQEGCRMQWIDDDRIIYNTRNQNNTGFHSVIYSITNGCVIKELSLPIATISVKKKIAICHSFIKNKYSYAFYGNAEHEIDRDGGVYLIDIETAAHKRLISLKDMENKESIHSQKSWVEHCMLSPNGEHFFFLHRWETELGAISMNLCVSDLNGNYRVLLRNTFVSHSGWRGNNQVSTWCRLPSRVNAIQRKGFLTRHPKMYAFLIDIYHSLVKKGSLRSKISNDAYVLFNIDGGGYEKILSNDLNVDGHETWNENCRYMLTDTYPDDTQRRKLLIYDSKTKEVLLLGKYYSFPKLGKGVDNNWNSSSMRCDLHPKQTFKGDYIYFDSVHEGYRGLYRIKISDYLEDWKS